MTLVPPSITRLRVRRLTLALLFALAPLAGADFFFIQMSDPQFGMYTSDKGFAQETANFGFAIATARRLKPAFVIVSGDLVNKAGDADEVAEYKRIAAALDPSIPLYNVAGNHDVGNEPTPESLAEYRRNFGADYYAFRSGSLKGIVLNSTLIAKPASAADEAARQEAWLEAELKKPREAGVEHRVIFQHHPWFVENADEPDGYFNIPAQARRKYLELFRKAGVRYLFSGHLHANALGRDGAIEMITTGPVGRPLGDNSRSGMRVVIVRAGRIEHQYYDFGALPNAVTLRP